MMTLHRHRRWVLAFWALLLAALPSGANPDGVGYSKMWINRTRVHVIGVDLSNHSIKVTPQLAYNAPGRRRSFISFIAEYKPLAQISGSFFSLRSNLPIGDIVVNSAISYRGPVGSALAIRPDNTAQIVNIPYGWLSSWPGYESVLKGGIRLVQNGKYAVYPRQQGFRDPSLFRKATRTAVGINGSKLYLVAINKPIQLSDLAAIMKGLGCKDAMALDGGTSTGMAFGSEVILTPGRTLSNVLMVVKRPEPAPKPVGNPEIAAPSSASPTTAPTTPTVTANSLFPVSPASSSMRVRLSPLLSSIANPLQFRYSESTDTGSGVREEVAGMLERPRYGRLFFSAR